MRYMRAAVVAWIVGCSVFVTLEWLATRAWAGVAAWGHFLVPATLVFAALALSTAPGFWLLQRFLASRVLRGLGAGTLGLLLGLVASYGVGNLFYDQGPRWRDLIPGPAKWARLLRPMGEGLRVELLFVCAGLTLAALVLGLRAFRTPGGHSSASGTTIASGAA